MVEKLPEHELPAIRVLAMPTDTNVAGDVFGGWIMSQVDLAGSVRAGEYTACRVVTIAVNSYTFYQPVFVGDLISCYARVQKVGRTSITIDVEVFAQRCRSAEDVIKVTGATLTYVAVDDNRKPRVIQPIN